MAEIFLCDGRAMNDKPESGLIPQNQHGRPCVWLMTTIEGSTRSERISIDPFIQLYDLPAHNSASKRSSSSALGVSAPFSYIPFSQEYLGRLALS